MAKSNVIPLEPGHFYHLYNRGINGENVFKSAENYPYFLQRYYFFAENVAETYAYCLLGNHFHILVKIKSFAEIQANLPKISPDNVKNVISQQFAHFFNGYAQAINHRYKRTGSLFEKPFRRKKIDSEQYLFRVLHYVHFNPEKHGFVEDFRAYPYSSYPHLANGLPTKLQRENVLEWFNGKDDFMNFHTKTQRYCEKEWDIEMD